MCGATGLHHYYATFLLLEEGDQVAPAHLALELRLSGLVDAVDLEDGLGGIQADHANAHIGRLPCCRFQRPAVWHIDAVRGPSTPSVGVELSAGGFGSAGT